MIISKETTKKHTVRRAIKHTIRREAYETRKAQVYEYVGLVEQGYINSTTMKVVYTLLDFETRKPIERNGIVKIISPTKLEATIDSLEGHTNVFVTDMYKGDRCKIGKIKDEYILYAI
jgi:hypothetical protein